MPKIFWCFACGGLVRVALVDFLIVLPSPNKRVVDSTSQFTYFLYLLLLLLIIIARALRGPKTQNFFGALRRITRYNY
uniref:Uncharacterized protein n=1 Tax=Romanomermis culicivorax TaxID=13658 RepID=A0A915HP13_ROMCU